MKKKGLISVLLTLAMILSTVSIAYAATVWFNKAESNNNTITVGDAVTLTLKDGDDAGVVKYFDGVSLAGPGSGTVATTITVDTDGDVAYSLKITNLVTNVEDYETVAFDAGDLYIKVAATEGELSSATAQKLTNNFPLIASATADQTVVIVIGLGADADIAFAGKTITFSIVADKVA